MDFFCTFQIQGAMVLLGITHPIPKDSGKDHSNSGIENSSATCAAAMRKSQLLGPNNKSIEPWVAGHGKCQG